MTDTASATDLNKAYGAGGAALVGGAVAKLLIRLINFKWPGFLDDGTAGAIDTISVAALAGVGAWVVPHRST